MDSQARGSKRNSRVKKRLTYFYLNGDLHRKIHANKGEDVFRAWNYPKHQLIIASYSDVRRRAEAAYTTTEAAGLLNRTRLTLERAILDGHIDPPQHTYGLETGNKFKYMWHEDDIWEMHAYLSTVHGGRPRKDGLVTPYNLPTPQELRARLNQEVTLYVKNGAGEFVPTWKAPDF